MDDEAQASSQAALRTFFQLAARWNLSRSQGMRLLGVDAEATYNAWKQGRVTHIPEATRVRLEILADIHEALRVLYGRYRDTFYPRVLKPADHPLLGGRKALDLLLSGELADLQRLQRYLHALRDEA
ncbi:MAG: DUF2384 domain-containing protein [Pseudomonadota bacterium]|uniref:hypothetical protein n=1 Tax=Thermithiobacillus tepidarius TaxID=929 RepID=UPI0003F5B1D3|nr:hypothetical protein [Thermithiobacillus tepidarius]